MMNKNKLPEVRIMKCPKCERTYWNIFEKQDVLNFCSYCGEGVILIPKPDSENRKGDIRKLGDRPFEFWGGKQWQVIGDREEHRIEIMSEFFKEAERQMKRFTREELIQQHIYLMVQKTLEELYKLKTNCKHIWVEDKIKFGLWSVVCSKCDRFLRTKKELIEEISMKLGEISKLDIDVKGLEKDLDIEKKLNGRLFEELRKPKRF